MDFGYTLDKFQLDAISELDAGNNVLITAHTGSGKTTVAKYICYKYLCNGQKIGRVCYTTPIKALSNQIYKNLSLTFPDISIGIKTGDVEINAEADLIVMTAEILRNQLFNNEAGYSAIILDEVHWIQDEFRGHVWSDIISNSSYNSQLLLLSATIDTTAFIEWISSVTQRKLTVIQTNSRVVPLSYYFCQNETYSFIPIPEIISKTDTIFKFSNDILAKIILSLKMEKYLPALFFCFSRKKCEFYVNQLCKDMILTDIEEQTKISRYIDSTVKKYSHLSLNKTKQFYKIKEYLGKGICYHHAGVIPFLKEIIETLFSQGLIKILFVTETFAVGINMPAKTVCFTSLHKTGRELTPPEFTQMAGRAGRRGIDTIGHVIIMPFDNKYDGLQYILSNKLTYIKVKEKLCFSRILNGSIKAHPEIPEGYLNLRGNKKKNVDIKLRKLDIYPERMPELVYFDFLNKNGYMAENVLTEKGIHAKEVNDCCDGILLTEICYSKILTDLTFPEICAVLSTLIEDKEYPEEISDISCIIRDRISKIRRLSENLYPKELNAAEIWPNDLNIILIHDWASGCDYSYLHKYIFCEGSFIKTILKLVGILEKCIPIFENIKLQEYLVIKKYREILIRETCIPDSLFVKIITYDS